MMHKRITNETTKGNDMTSFYYEGNDVIHARRLSAFITSNYNVEPIHESYDVDVLPNILFDNDGSFEVMLDDYPHIMSVESVTDNDDGTFTFHNVSFHDDPQHWEDIAINIDDNRPFIREVNP